MEEPISSAEYAAMSARENSQKQRKLEERIDILEYEIERIKQKITILESEQE